MSTIYIILADIVNNYIWYEFGFVSLLQILHSYPCKIYTSRKCILYIGNFVIEGMERDLQGCVQLEDNS